MEYMLKGEEKLIIEPMTEADLDWVAKLEEETFPCHGQERPF